MSRSLAVSARAALIAGVSTAVVGAMAVTPVSSTALAPVRTLSPAVQLSAALESLDQPAVGSTDVDPAEPALYDAGPDTVLYTASPTAAATTGVESFIKNTYNAIEPWVAWGFQLAQWAMGFIPIVWWVAPGVSLAYYTIEPLVQAGVYTFADVLGLNFSQIGPDIRSGIQQSWQNFVNYGLAWIGSLIPLPPLPPFPPRPFASVPVKSIAASRAAAAAAAVVADEAVSPVSAEAPSGESTATTPAAPASRGGRGSIRTSRAAAPTHAPVPAAAADASSTDLPPAEPVLTVESPTVSDTPAKASRNGSARAAHGGKSARTAGRAG